MGFVELMTAWTGVFVRKGWKGGEEGRGVAEGERGEGTAFPARWIWDGSAEWREVPVFAGV